MSLRIKLMSAFIVVAMFSAIVGGLNYWVLNEVVKKSEHVSKINLENAVSLGKMIEAAHGAQTKVWQIIGTHEHPEKLAQIVKEMNSYAQIYVDIDKIYQTIPFVEGEQELYDAQNNPWLKTLEDIKKISEMANSGNAASIEDFANQTFDDHSEEHIKNLKVLFEFQNKEGHKWSTDAANTANFGFKLSLGAVAAGFLIASLIGLFVANQLSTTLQNISTELSHGAEQVSSISTDVASASTELSESSAEQAASLQETVSSIDEVSAMVANNADNSQKSLGVSEENQKTANTGKQVVENMMEAIHEIQQSNNEVMKQVDDNNREMTGIVNLINEIGEKTRVINDIVFQTKLLSFNASVEAARAGEHGKGFAVVAEEVGKLASMSGSAAKDISQLLDNSIQKVESIVNESKQKAQVILTVGQEKIKIGQKTAEDCKVVLEEIYQKSFSVNEMMKSINNASQEQATGVREISQAMNQLNTTIQQNTTASQQCAVSAENLKMQSGILGTLVDQLQSTISGQKNQSAQGAMITFHKNEKQNFNHRAA